MTTPLRARVDPFARALGFYTAYRIDPAEHIRTIDKQVGPVAADFRRLGYRDVPAIAGIPLEAAKEHPANDDQYHRVSLRRRPLKHPTAAEGTPLTSERPQHCQYHVHLFQTDAGTELYSHYELRPDLGRLTGETVSDWINRLETHFQPAYGETYLRGVSDL
jgi:hypothetical protein